MLGRCVGPLGVVVKPGPGGTCPPGYTYVPATEVEQAEVYEVKGRRLPEPIIRPAHHREAYCRRMPGYAKHGLAPAPEEVAKKTKKRRRKKKKEEVAEVPALLGAVRMPPGPGGTCPPGYVYVPETVVTEVKGRTLPEPIVRPAYCRRLPGYAKHHLVEGLAVFPEDVGPFVGMGQPIVGAAKWMFSAEGLKGAALGVGSAVLGYWIKKQLGKIKTKEKKPVFSDKAATALGGLAAALIGYEIGRLAFKDVRLGEMAAIAALATAFAPIVRETIGLSGTELGQVRIPEEVEIRGLDQVRIPEEAEIRGLEDLGQEEEGEEIITEEELLGDEGERDSVF